MTRHINRELVDHILVGTTHTFRAEDRGFTPYDPDFDRTPGKLILGNNMGVEIKAAFQNWNGVPDLDMLRVYCPTTSEHTFVTPEDLGLGPLTERGVLPHARVVHADTDEPCAEPSQVTGDDRRCGHGYRTAERLEGFEPEPEPGPVKRNSILEEREEGTYYTGPLARAIGQMREFYGSSISVSRDPETGVWTAVEHRGGDRTSPNQWGRGKSEEEAWRYLIGQEYGPIDDTYEDEGYEAHQRRMLGLS